MKLVEWDDDFWAFEDGTLTPKLHQQLDEAVEALEEGAFDDALAGFLAVLDKHPWHIDALYHIALLHEAVGEATLTDTFVCAAVGVGLNALPDRFSWTRSRLEWGVMENRPFLRAYHYLALRYLERGELEEAISVLRRLLAVSPNDNLGVRLLLPQCWLGLGDVESVLTHCRAYEEDGSPEIRYTYPLALTMSDDEAGALTALKNATAELPLVGKELLKKRHREPQSATPGFITHGGADQAYAYWKQYGSYWSKSPQALRLLEQCYP